jgi:hypothetical protein
VSTAGVFEAVAVGVDFSGADVVWFEQAVRPPKATVRMITDAANFLFIVCPIRITRPGYPVLFGTMIVPEFRWLSANY